MITDARLRSLEHNALRAQLRGQSILMPPSEFLELIESEIAKRPDYERADPNEAPPPDIVVAREDNP